MFKSLEIKKSALEKLPGERGELLKADIEGPLKSLPPGEWVLLRDPHQKRVFLGYANPLVEDHWPAVRVLCRLRAAPQADEAERYLRERLQQAFARRRRFDGYENGARLVFGDADGLPGLQVDAYRNVVLVQVNTAGMDRWRELIAELLTAEAGLPVHFLDNPTQRSREMLPHYRAEAPIPDLEIGENGFQYLVPRRNLQKIGWYYDHRENRRKLEAALTRWRGTRDTGVDLFCYGGAWGMHLLRAGVAKVDFVDQAPMDEMVEGHLRANGFPGRGEFHRDDVFDWLEARRGQTWDVVVSDPPAFAKSPREKANAVEGYRKLHRRALAAVRPGGLFAAASCTHYLDLGEFVHTIEWAAQQDHLKIQILDLGLQGWDHPVAALADRGNYIKYALCAVEKE